MEIIARIHTDFPDKFGIPRQSGILDTLEATIVFDPKYRSAEALRGIEEWSHLWLIWEFSENKREEWSPTVRPPRLGGNKRVGVFATRSPFRPNPIGLSCVRLLGLEKTPDKGIVLRIAGADLMDGTPIYDIKPYLPYTDSHPDATGSFGEELYGEKLTVNCSDDLLSGFPKNKKEALFKMLAEDPRPAVRASDTERIFGLKFAGYEIKFCVLENVLTVVDISPLE